MASSKTPKAMTALLFAQAAESTPSATPAPETIVDHEQIAKRSQFEAIAKANSIDALSMMYRTLLEGLSSAEFERIGYGTAIRARAHVVLHRKAARNPADKNAAGVIAKEQLEKHIKLGSLPPRPESMRVAGSSESVSMSVEVEAKPAKRARRTKP